MRFASGQRRRIVEQTFGDEASGRSFDRSPSHANIGQTLVCIVIDGAHYRELGAHIGMEGSQIVSQRNRFMRPMAAASAPDTLWDRDGSGTSEATHTKAAVQWQQSANSTMTWQK